MSVMYDGRRDLMVLRVKQIWSVWACTKIMHLVEQENQGNSWLIQVHTGKCTVPWQCGLQSWRNRPAPFP